MKQVNAEKLRAWRHTQRLSLERMAQELGISYVTLQKWETGKRKLGISPLGWQALITHGYSE